MPGMKAVGTKTDERTRAIPITGPGELLHRFSSRVLGIQALFDVALHTFHDDDGVVHHQADGQHQPEHRKRIDGEAEQREEDKGSNQRDRHGQQRNQRGAPVLQKEIDHQDHQHDRDHERLRESPSCLP